MLGGEPFGKRKERKEKIFFAIMETNEAGTMDCAGLFRRDFCGRIAFVAADLLGNGAEHRPVKRNVYRHNLRMRNGIDCGGYGPGVFPCGAFSYFMPDSAGRPWVYDHRYPIVSNDEKADHAQTTHVNSGIYEPGFAGVDGEADPQCGIHHNFD